MRQAAPHRPIPQALGESLVAHGAPLAGWSPHARLSPEDTLLEGLQAARHHATIFRALPVLVARQAGRFDWPRLRAAARERQQERELGMLLELTAELLADPTLAAEAERLRPERVAAPEFFFPPRNRWDRALAEEQSPAIAARWGFVVNMTLDALRSLLERHLAAIPAR